TAARPRRASAERPRVRRPSGDEDARPPVDLGELSAEEAAALAAPGDLGEDERRRIVEMVRRAARGTYFDLLGVLPTADKKELKRAYFRVSKEFHPDRYYGRDLGPFGPWL